MEGKIKYWIDLSNYDMDTAEAMLKSKRYLYVDLNIEARYPSHKERLLKSLSEKKCLEIIQNTKELQKWIKERL